MPQKYEIYYRIKQYLETKVYEGATYQEMISHQNDNTTKWLETFTNLPDLKLILTKILETTTNKCNYQAKLNKILA